MTKTIAPVTKFMDSVATTTLCLNKTMKRYIIASALFTLPAIACAQSIATPSSRAVDLSYVLGIDSIISGVKTQVETSNRLQMNAAFEQIKKAYPQLTRQQLESLRTDADRVLNSIQNSWTAEEIKTIYVSELSEKLSTEDINKAIQFYSTASGRSVYSVARSAEQKAISHIASAQEKAMSEAMNAFLTSVKATLSKKTK